MMEGSNSFKVIVIGAGMAGVSAAHSLITNGVTEVLVLEARNRIGGRIHTLQHDGNPLELGAQWIQGGCPSNSVFNLANQFALLGQDLARVNDSLGSSEDLIDWPLSYGFVFRTNGEPVSEEATKHAYEIFKAIRTEIKTYYGREFKTVRSNRALKDRTRLLTFYNSRMRKAVESLRKEVHKAVADEVEVVLSGFRNAMTLIAGEDMENCRLELLGLKADLPGGHVHVPDGVVGILEAMIKDSFSEDTLKLGRKVTLIDWSLLSGDPKHMDKILVECVTPEGHVEEYFANFVISTLPLGVLKRFHQQIFYPGLTQDKVRAVQAIGCGHVTKLALHWRQPWWAKGEGNLTLAWSNDEMRARVLPRDWPEYIFNLTEVENQPKVLMAWIAGSGARVVDQLDEDEVVLGITELLRKFTGDLGLPPPAKVARDTWSLDPYSLGSISCPLLNTDEHDFDLMASPLPNETDPRLLFAGEATSCRYFGSMNGARLSGLREAQRILDKVVQTEKMSKELDKLSDTWLD